MQHIVMLQRPQTDLKRLKIKLNKKIGCKCFACYWCTCSSCHYFDRHRGIKMEKNNMFLLNTLMNFIYICLLTERQV